MSTCSRYNFSKFDMQEFEKVHGLRDKSIACVLGIQQWHKESDTSVYSHYREDSRGKDKGERI